MLDTPPPRPIAPAWNAHKGAAALLRRALDGHGFTRLDTVALSASPDALRSCGIEAGDTSALGALVDLFVLQLPVRCDVASNALAPLPVETLAEVGLICVDGESVYSPFRLNVFDAIVCATDPFTGVSSTRPHGVAALGALSYALANATVRREVTSALDLGTGSGLQALLASRHAARVIGVDADHRALSFAKFNAVLNGVDTVEWCEGDWYAPVEGLRFDLITANPQYGLDDADMQQWQTSGLPTDAAAERVTRNATRHLQEDGLAHIQWNWIFRQDCTWTEPPVFDEIRRDGCDVAIFVYGTANPVRFAGAWNTQMRRDDPEEFRRAVSRWSQWYREQRIDAVAQALVVVRRRSKGDNWILVHELQDALRSKLTGDIVWRTLQQGASRPDVDRPAHSLPRSVSGDGTSMRRAIAGTAPLPNFLVLGAMRAGTSSLAWYLNAHPDAFVPPEKELYFFSNDKLYTRGLDWYRHRFARHNGAVAVGEATPHYLISETAPARIAAALPDVKLIAILRDPAERAWSHYWLNRMWKTERRDFVAALNDEWRGLPGQPGYLRFGLYNEQLRRYLDHFRRHQIHVMLFEDLQDDPQRAFAGLCQFLEIDATDAPANVGMPFNQLTRIRSPRLWLAMRDLRQLGGRTQTIVRAIDNWNLDHSLPIARPRLPLPLRNRMGAWYQPHTQALEQLLQRDLSGWESRAG